MCTNLALVGLFIFWINWKQSESLLPLWSAFRKCSHSTGGVIKNTERMDKSEATISVRWSSVHELSLAFVHEFPWLRTCNHRDQQRRECIYWVRGVMKNPLLFSFLLLSRFRNHLFVFVQLPDTHAELPTWTVAANGCALIRTHASTVWPGFADCQSIVSL